MESTWRTVQPRTWNTSPVRTRSIAHPASTSGSAPGENRASRQHPSISSATLRCSSTVLSSGDTTGSFAEAGGVPPLQRGFRWVGALDAHPCVELVRNLKSGVRLLPAFRCGRVRPLIREQHANDVGAPPHVLKFSPSRSHHQSGGRGFEREQRLDGHFECARQPEREQH